MGPQRRKAKSIPWVAAIAVLVLLPGGLASTPAGQAFLSGSPALASTGFSDDGPGGPILVIASSANPFTRYYGEILKSEGLNEYHVVDVATLTPTLLSAYDVAILGETSLTTAQTSTLTDWVNAGGNLISMRPDKKLAGLLGLADAAAQISEAYVKVDTQSAAGAGIVADTMQFHGTADRYTLAGATSIATIYSNATTATANPAVTTRAVGAAGGTASSFTFDLARSIVYSRQGNPTWAGQERDGTAPIRSDDLYFGAKTGDVQPDWVDLAKVSIPQADEQQRLLVNLIEQVNANHKPVPRFWYLPKGNKAAIVMTGDDHGNGGTAGRFDNQLAQSSAGCSVANWECIRSTSYIYTSTPLTNSDAANYAAQGFEIGLHVSTNCADWTSQSQLDSFYSDQLAQWTAKYTSLPSPTTNRTHCVPWSDWPSQPAVEVGHGMRLDTTYYYWPSSWVTNRPGFFTGSGFPMRFAALDGSLVDVYQATTQMTDESGQVYPYTVDTLLDNALGAPGYYGVFTANMHTDTAASTGADAIVASAKARGVPVVSARQMLTWLDGRNTSSFGSVTWSGSTLSFDVAPGSGATGLQAMVPARPSATQVTSITRGGAPVSYTTQTIKGIDYAFFDALAGHYDVSYGADVTPPTVAASLPSAGATNVAPSTMVQASFSEPVQPTTISFQLRDASNALVPATVSYDPGSRTATLDPTSDLAASTTYTATVSGATDLAGNSMAAPASWSFTTASPPACPCTIWSPSATPAVPSENDSSGVEVGVKFRSDVAGQITGIRFYKGTGNTGTHIGNLWTVGGTKLASATFSNETSSGWQQVNFASPVTVNAGTTYVASYYAPSGHYAATAGGFAAAGVDNPPLHALADGVDGPNGVYGYGASGFPTNTYQSTNYWVDVVFAAGSSSTTTTTTAPTTTTTAPTTTTTAPTTTTTAPVDTTPPTVTSTSPKAGATQVAVTAKPSATFSEPVVASSINFTLRDSAGLPVAGLVSYDASSRTATFTPAVSLLPATKYTASVAATDVGGNAMPNPYTWSFTTKK